MTVRELINKLAQYDLSTEVLITANGVVERPKCYEAQGYIMLDLDTKYKHLFIQNQVDLEELMKEE